MADPENADAAQPQQSPLAPQFWAARGEAIDAYSTVEHIFCELFAHLTKMKIETASLIFFKMNNTRVLAEIMTALIEKQYRETYEEFWLTLRGKAKGLTDTRNLIVHGSEASFSNPDGRGFMLIRSDYWNFLPENQEKRKAKKKLDKESEIRIEDLLKFVDECDFVWLFCSEFLYLLRGGDLAHVPEDKRETWRQMFQNKIVYPPVSSHPLYAKWKEHRARRLSSRAIIVLRLGTVEVQSNFHGSICIEGQSDEKRGQKTD